MDRLDEIQARCDAATLGPWEFTPGGAIYHDPLKLIAHVLGSGEDSVSNASFIAHSREDIPYLLAEVKRLRDLLADRNVLLDKYEADAAVLTARAEKAERGRDEAIKGGPK